MLKFPSSRFNKCLHFVSLASDIFKEMKHCRYSLWTNISILFPSLFLQKKPPSSNECCYSSAVEVFILFLQLDVLIIYSIALCAFKKPHKIIPHISWQRKNFFLIIMLWTCIHAHISSLGVLIYHSWRKIALL